MSDEELIEGYTQGRISRRILVRRLVAGGLTVSAALAYGIALAPGQAAAAPGQPTKNDKPPKHHKHHNNPK